MSTRNSFSNDDFGERTIAALEDLVANPQTLLRASRALSKTAVPNYQLELDILSASTYPQAPLPTDRSRKRNSQQLFGGLLVDDLDRNPSDSNNSDAGRPPLKKKSRRAPKGSDDDDPSRKQRGRPRLDTQDETAADRRRTQIRLAQRAYRHRKETTISALKQKVSEMEQTIDSMNKSFSQLHDNLFESGVLTSKPQLAQQLKATTEQFIALAKAASQKQDSDQEEEATSVGKARLVAPQENFLSEPNLEQPQASSSTWGYEFSTADPEEEAFSRADYQGDDESDQIMTTDLAEKPSSQWNTENQFQQFNVHIPEVNIDWDKLTAEIERPLPSREPYTYSFQETTFARRLHRMSLETGFRNLTNPKIDPTYINRAFKFTFCFSNKKRMLVRFQDLLRRKAGESLENWDVPFVPIGGAGTHFPRRDEHGNPIYPPNMISPARFFGPQAYISPETPREGETLEEMLENIGYGGEWFDAHDVEEYLKTKGIYLDGKSSFVEVDSSMISLSALTNSSRSPISSSSRSPAKTPEPMNPPALINNTYTGDLFNGDFELDLPSVENMQDKSDVASGSVAFGAGFWNHGVSFAIPESPGYVPTFQDLLSRKQQPVTVDVNKFLTRLVRDAATCLGRAPGFRREMVDNALALSLQEAF